MKERDLVRCRVFSSEVLMVTRGFALWYQCKMFDDFRVSFHFSFWSLAIVRRDWFVLDVGVVLVINNLSRGRWSREFSLRIYSWSIPFVLGSPTIWYILDTVCVVCTKHWAHDRCFFPSKHTYCNLKDESNRTTQHPRVRHHTVVLDTTRIACRASSILVDSQPATDPRAKKNMELDDKPCLAELGATKRTKHPSQHFGTHVGASLSSCRQLFQYHISRSAPRSRPSRLPVQCFVQEKANGRHWSLWHWHCWGRCRFSFPFHHWAHHRHHRHHHILLIINTTPLWNHQYPEESWNHHIVVFGRFHNQ